MGDSIEVVHTESSVEVAMTNASGLGGHGAITCLLGLDLSGYEYVRCTPNGFVPMSLKPIDNRLNTTV